MLILHECLLVVVLFILRHFLGVLNKYSHIFFKLADFFVTYRKLCHQNMVVLNFFTFPNISIAKSETHCFGLWQVSVCLYISSSTSAILIGNTSMFPFYTAHTMPPRHIIKRISGHTLNKSKTVPRVFYLAVGCSSAGAPTPQTSHSLLGNLYLVSSWFLIWQQPSRLECNNNHSWPVE